MALLRNEWIRLGVVGVVMVVLGVAAGLVIAPGGKEKELGSVGDRVVFTNPVPAGSEMTQARSPGRSVAKVVVEQLPLTAAEAVVAGWKDPVLCAPGRGRYFHKDPASVPYFLMYNSEDELIGIYHFSRTETPLPWERMQELLVGGRSVIDFEHWGLFTYFQDHTRACGVKPGGQNLKSYP